ncbi:HupE/UreJ family protein [Thiocapsa rosea]|uniref:HupE/UreJ protein n=1 Tax=Thiocapsa rosea TaxID=69360 RepID=A0A495V1M4_9GAMM|nr:HupE/UreJ family protein [Thiocapsa rosea]RKT43189.1 HupE/UreJ protein [Thiocapsa rosea]
MRLTARSPIPTLILWTALLGAAGAASTVAAHPLDPALLEIRESPTGTLDVLWRLPVAQTAGVPLRAILPAGCTPMSAPVASRAGSRVTLRWRAQCADGGLVGSDIGVDGLRERSTDAVLRVHLADGRLVQAVLRGDNPTFTVPESAGRLDVLRDYLLLGFEHILGGPDHLLFVFGLVLLVQGYRRLFWTITAFTAGHSVTLALAVLGVVTVPSHPVEALIALTIVVVAVELTRAGPGHATWIQRFPWVMAFTFGLLHGLGFAGALTEIGLPAHEVPLALAAFNIGIEVGQLLCVAVILTAAAVRRSVPVSLPTAARHLPSYVIGSLAVFWVLERSTAMF